MLLTTACCCLVRALCEQAEAEAEAYAMMEDNPFLSLTSEEAMQQGDALFQQGELTQAVLAYQGCNSYFNYCSALPLPASPVCMQLRCRRILTTPRRRGPS